MTDLQSWEEKGFKSFREALAEAKEVQESATLRETLAKIKAERNKAKRQTLDDALTNKKNLIQDNKRKLIDDVLLSAKLTVQEQMLDEIKSGISIDDVLAKYKTLIDKNS